MAAAMAARGSMGRWDWGQIVAPVIYILLIAVLAVFGHSALQGEHGLAALRQAEALEAELTAELAGVGEERRELENRVRRLGLRHLDLDLLDERARAMLGYVRREELVIR
ncbi:MAG: FtsB family cell division protein [Thermohalobaculum sp.]